MKYFGKKSVSSVISAVLHVSWYVILAVSIAAVLFTMLALLYQPVGDMVSSEIAKGIGEMGSKDQKDWEAFVNMPLVFKFIIIPYFSAFIVLLLKIIKKSQLLFTNFKQDIVFDKSNVQVISSISKLNIAFSIITFNFSLLLVSILLFMICEIFNKGSALQEEHDLTV